MKRIAWYSLAMGLPMLITACGGGSTEQTQTTEELTDAEEIAVVTLAPLTDSPTFPEASLVQNMPAADGMVPDGSVNFNFSVEGYELGAQTSDAEGKGLANSGNGQHIHLILNNGPYSAHYEPVFEKEMEPGHYVSLAFLSRSYHESVKNAAAAQITQFTVGDAEATPADLSAPHLFYSRPKGEYVGPGQTDKVLLDFYLLNCDLSEGGYTIKATINGQDFTITDWTAYTMEGLVIGENTIRLELLDAEGNTVNSPFNPVERTVMLKDAPAE